jgi:hypothetical protein
MSMNHKSDDKHALVLEYYDDASEDYEIEVVHSQSCTVWFGCEFREEKGVQRLDGCPNYHHAHRRLDCPIGYSIEAIGLSDTLFYGDATLEAETLEVLKRYIGQPVPIHCNFSWGTYSYGLDGYEYDEEFTWEFKPYYTHTWTRTHAICVVCGSTAQYVIENNYECEVPDGKSK